MIRIYKLLKFQNFLAVMPEMLISDMGKSYVWCDQNCQNFVLWCTRSISDCHHETLGHLVPVLTEECPELRLNEERKTIYGNMREGTSFEQLIIDERDSRKVVIETLRLYQGEQKHSHSTCSHGFHWSHYRSLAL